MKLLRVVRSLNPVYGGIVEGCRQMTPALKDNGVITTFISFDSPNDTWILNEKDLDIIALGPTFLNYGFNFNLVKKIRHISLNYDAVIIEGIWQYHSLATFLAVYPLKLPYFVYTHGMLDPWFNKQSRIKYFKKKLYWILAEQRVISNSCSIFYTTNQECLLSRQSFPPLHANEKVVGYGISCPPAESQDMRTLFFSEYPHLKGKKLILFFGRVHPKKGLDLLMQAFSSVFGNDRNYHLVIAGPASPECKRNLVELSIRCGIDGQVEWLGMLAGDLKWSTLYSSDLFCLPSYQENFGVSVVEALACGVNVAISKSVNISPDVSAFNAGIVHETSLQGTISALNQWNSMDQNLRNSMSHRAKNLFLSKYHVSNVAFEVASYIRNVTTGSS